ncbi:MAG TPA: FecR family protein [Niabella sp.]|nr:FecR family protein [Niabella sp.]
MIQDKLAILISRKLSGEATEEEIRELEDWLKNHPQDQYFSAVLNEYWQGHTQISIDTNEKNIHFEQILKLAETEATDTNKYLKKFKIIRLKYLWPAASIVFIIVGFLLWSSMFSLRKTNEVAVAKGAKTQIILPDGSKVWLNSASKLRYSKNFNTKSREVTLEGEGFFDVIRDSARPFIVHTRAIDIHVLGTSFNVKDYGSDKAIETTLIKGLIEIVNKSDTHPSKIILHPKEKLIFNKVIESQKKENFSKSDYHIVSLPKTKPDTAINETSWIHNRLVFEGDTFRELAKKMERWYNVEIIFYNEKTANFRLRGVFEDESLDQAMKGLQMIAPFSFKVNGNKIEIY